MAAALLVLAILCALASSCCCSSPTPAPGCRPRNLSDCRSFITFDSFRSAPPPDDGTLHFLVPWKVGFREFVTVDISNCNITGFSVEVFRLALSCMQYPGPPKFRFVVFGDGKTTPSYNTMVELVHNQTVDGVVADVTITNERAAKVGFTVPYVPSSPLVMLTAIRDESQGRFWIFSKPFSKSLWFAVLALLITTGIALYWCEVNDPEVNSFYSREIPMLSVDNDNNFEQDVFGPPNFDQTFHFWRIANAFWYAYLCVFHSQKKMMRTHLGRIIILTWLFALVILTASYTAALANFLSSQKRYPAIAGFQALVSDPSISVGVQQGSFLESYMTKLNLGRHNITSLVSLKQFAKALRIGNGKPGGVGAVLDQLSFVGALPQFDCDITRSSRPDDNLPSFGGFGFAFQQGEQGERLIEQVSEMIMKMAEEKTLQELWKTWDPSQQIKNKCSSDADPTSLSLQSFGGLFTLIAVLYTVCVICGLCKKAIKSYGEAIILTLASSQHEIAIDTDTEDVS